MVANPQMDRGGNTPDYLINRFVTIDRTLGQLASKSPLPILDNTGTELVALDHNSNWGLRSPRMDVVLYQVSPDAPTVTAGTWTTLYQGFFTVIHPRLYLSAILVTKGASTVAGQLQWVVDSPSMTAATTTTAVLAGVGTTQDTQTVDFAAADNGGLCQLRLQVQMSGTVAGGNLTFAYPLLAWRVGATYPN